ncbi:MULTISPECIES: MraY family glycosyltransferase [Tepidimonas]|uniref:Putative undecaprenyl-phosphate N-acetylglucosaminyl 1-phosphate transferase n=2 Tax=Tepidimonas TaxID=114248 RepID=A0A554XHM5_9BURK|nr:MULTISPECIES: glycosyltransferase [Tepidimonas]TSE23823.1 putative undecaprenyl-phosphate N-acetylglucosaminyl 1-phosphate transferase [Tepidimonas aquatica]TSE35336.1 putative undecaprenyl-phosphate N-acetylglucosaminyl 1-phosphate transferase [Tepidimonas fonticaldi]
MQTVLVATIVAYLATLAIMRLGSQHLHPIHDPLEGVQKFHTRPVPRIGGVAVFVAVVVALAWSAWRGLVESKLLGLALASLPVFAAGLAEDLTKRVSPRARLLAAAGSAALAGLLVGAWLPRLGIPLLDDLLHQWPVPGLEVGVLAVLITLVATTGLTHAINIIDGFNGLAAAACALMFAGMGYVAWALGDQTLAQLCLAAIGALLGFLAWNYPRGWIFLGDGGAYLLGFTLAQVAILLVGRHPQLSPWFPFLVCLYPIVETLFSIYRKWIVRRMSPGLPDALHLHMLVYRRLLRWAAGTQAARDFTRRNAATAPYLWALTSLSVVPAVLFWYRPPVLIACAVAFAVLYLLLYVRLVRFRAPAWLKRRLGRS